MSNRELHDESHAGRASPRSVALQRRRIVARADDAYIPLISKGFQHQFWQAVKAGAEQAAKELNVRITFEGPGDRGDGRQADRHAGGRARQEAAGASASPRSTARRPSRSCRRRRPTRSRSSPSTPASTATFRSPPARPTTSPPPALAADKMAELIGDAGEVAVVVHDQTSRTGIDRRDGFVKRDEGEASEHQDRRRPVRRRRPAEVGRNRQGDPAGQSEPEGHLRRQRGLGDRRC